MLFVNNINELEAQIGDYDGKGLDYDGKQCIELPKNIFNAVNNNDLKSVMDWLSSPVDQKRLSAKYPDLLNATLVHLAVCSNNAELLSILLQYGADVNASDAAGFTPLLIAAQTGFIELAKILQAVKTCIDEGPTEAFNKEENETDMRSVRSSSIRRSWKLHIIGASRMSNGFTRMPTRPSRRMQPRSNRCASKAG